MLTVYLYIVVLNVIIFCSPTSGSCYFWKKTRYYLLPWHAITKRYFFVYRGLYAIIFLYQ